MKIEHLCIQKSPGLNDVIGKHTLIWDMVHNNFLINFQQYWESGT